MTNLQQHCNISLQRTSFDFEELHRWIDDSPNSKRLGVDHRVERHAFTISEMNYIKSYWEAKKGVGWGDKAVVEWLFHIAIDNIDTAFKISKKYYGPLTYNFIKIGLESSGKINVEFKREIDYQLHQNFKERK